jgi:hypothetical protein
MSSSIVQTDSDDHYNNMDQQQQQQQQQQYSSSRHRSDRQHRHNGNSNGAVATTTSIPMGAKGLNHRLITRFIDVSSHDDSCGAHVIRMVTYGVGQCITPKQMLSILRVLKASTFSFLVLTILADIMYMVFLEIIPNNEALKEMVGGVRDTIIRVYGIILAFIALCIELDYLPVVKAFSCLKRFFFRGIFMFLIAVMTSSHPTMQRFSSDSNDRSSSAYQASSGSSYAGANDDASGDDSVSSSNNNNSYISGKQYAELEYPTSAVNFQLVTSLGL